MKLIRNIYKFLSPKPTDSAPGFFRRIVAFTTIAGSLFVVSCTRDNEIQPDDPTTMGEGVTVTFNIPASAFSSQYPSTRADEYRDPVTDAEGTINYRSLYLVVFKETLDYDSNDKKAYTLLKDGVKEISTAVGNLSSGYSDSRKYHLNLEQGNYKFYLLANIRGYWTNTEGTANDDAFEELITKEENIQNLQLSFADKIEGTNLPMACMPEEMYSDENHTTPLKGEITIGEDGKEVGGEAGVLTITPEDIENKTKKTVYAPMKILCSKVRFTVLFDRTDFSDQFPGNNIDFQSPAGVSNVMSRTILKEPETNSSIAPLQYINNPDFNRVSYPNEDSSNDEEGTYGYLDITKQTKSPNPLEILQGNQTWDIDSKRAWQGELLYLPENTNSDPDKVTTIHLKPSDGSVGMAQEGYFIKLNNMQRGHFYDVVAKLITSSVMEVKVMVKVNPWQYNSQAADSW